MLGRAACLPKLLAQATLQAEGGACRPKGATSVLQVRRRLRLSRADALGAWC